LNANDAYRAHAHLLRRVVTTWNREATARPLGRGGEGDGRAGDRVSVLVGDGDGERDREAHPLGGGLAVGGAGGDAVRGRSDVLQGVLAGLCAGSGGGCGEG